MPTIYRPNGSRNFIIQYVDADGRRRKEYSQTPERRVAERIAAGIAEQVALRRAGLVDRRAEAIAQHAARPIDGHVQDWLADVAARGRTALHVAELGFSLRRVLERGEIRTLAGLAPSAVQLALGRIRDEKRPNVEDDPERATEARYSLRTVNRGVRAVKSFTRWLARDGRLRDDPIAFLPAYNDATDRRRFRRALTRDEIETLCRSTEAGATVRGLSGRDRAMLYRLAVGTGFRVSEIESLSIASFRLDDEPPTVTVEAGQSKRRRRDVQPLHPSLAAILRPWIAGRPAGERAFRLDAPAKSRKPGAIRRLVTPLREVAAKMLRADAIAAGVSTAEVDFHALRHTFVTAIVRSGADLRSAQELARHSDPRLTVGRYAHARIEDKTRALEATAPSSAPTAGLRAKTGTEGALAD